MESRARLQAHTSLDKTTGDVVECDFHNGAFNIRTGAVVAPPCMIPLKTYRTVVDSDGFVLIEVAR